LIVVEKFLIHSIASIIIQPLPRSEASFVEFCITLKRLQALLESNYREWSQLCQRCLKSFENRAQTQRGTLTDLAELWPQTKRSITEKHKSSPSEQKTLAM